MEEGRLVAHRFVIEQRAAAGGMGTVYRARDRVSGAPVAVKLVADATQSSARFEQEARVLCDLEHAAIVRYVAHGAEDDGRAYLVMEWLEGEDLATRLSRGPLGVEETLTIGRRVVEALSYAHARGIVHRDVKPGNLFLLGGDPARTKVLDFGIARSRVAGAFDTTLLPITRTGAVIGTVGYMSPEQARGATDVDARTDVFALGCVLFECLTGRPAFAGANAVAVLAKVLLEEAPRVRASRRDVPSGLDELIARMLAKNPGDRPRDVGRALSSIVASGSHGSASSSGGTVTDREQRLVSIVLARGVAANEARGLLADAEVIELADGALVFALRGIDPVTHAASAALALRRGAAGSAIAVATGRMLTGHDLSIGPIIDRAATILPAAGETVVDELSSALLSDRFEIAGSRLVGVARRTSEPRTLLGKRTPCVGRDKELALLDATFRECVDDAVARAVLITAPAGGGKSRLQRELMGRVGQDATVLFARADPMGAGSPLGLVRQLVQNAAGIREGHPNETRHAVLRTYLARFFSDDTLDRHAEMLGELIGAPPAVAGPSLRAARDDARILATWLRRAFETWLEAACDAGPMLLVVEDLHWGDRASVAFLEESLRKNANRPLMVVALARPEVHELFPELWAKVGVQEVRLPALTRRAAERLVRALLSDASDSLVEHVVARAEGNAFYLEELIRHVAEGRGATLPETVLALAEARVARLDGDRRRVLRAASVFGEVFWEAGVAALLEDAREMVPATLHAMIEEELLTVHASSKFAGERELAFRHGLLRDVAYAIATDEDRALSHLRAGEWLQKVGDKDARVLAEHFDRSTEPTRATPFFVLAAEQAFADFDLDSVGALAERAIAHGASGEERGRLRLSQAITAAGRAQRAEATRFAKEAYGLLPARTPHRYLAAATALQAGAYIGDFELAPEIVQDLLTHEPEQPSGPYGLAVQFVSDILDGFGQRESADLLLARGDRFADSGACDPVFLGWLRYSQAAGCLRRGDLGRAYVFAREGLAHFESMRESFGAAITELGMGVLHTELGKTALAREWLQKSATFFGRSRGLMVIDWCRLHEAWGFLYEGRPRMALEIVSSTFAGPDHRHARALATLAHLSLGEMEQAEQMSALALDGIGDFLVTPWVVTLVHVARARVLHARGRDHEAIETLDVAERASHGLLPPGVRAHLELARVESLRALGLAEAARDELGKACERIERQRRGLERELSESYVTLPHNARLLELAHTP